MQRASPRQRAAESRRSHNQTCTFKGRNKTELIRLLNDEREKRMQLQRQLQEANVANENLKKDAIKTKNKLHYLSKGHRKRDPYKNTCYLIRQLKGQSISNTEIVNGVLDAITSKSRMLKELGAAVIRREDLLQDVSEYFKVKNFKELKYKFRPWICLRELDMSAVVSFRAYDTICMIEFVEEENKKYRRGLLHSRHKLSKLCRQLEDYSRDLLPYELTENSVKFDVQTAVQFILQRHGLWEGVLNKEKVTFAATVDGGELAWKITQVSAGIKMVDPRAVDLVSGTFLFGNSGYDKVQSKHHCYPLYIIIAKDNKQLYQNHLAQFFNDVNRLEEEHQDGLIVAQGADMCSLHKTLGVGGGMKVKTYACYCCPVHRDNLARPLENPCEDCVRLGKTQPCYHTKISDESVIERMREEMQDLLHTWYHLHHLPFNGRSRLRFSNYGVNNIIDPANDNLHIDFEPRTRIERVQHRNLLESELRLHNITHLSNHTTAEIKIYLHEILLVEKSFELLDSIINAKNYDEAMIRLEQALPDLLHLENRTSEAIIEHLLRQGIRLREGDKEATEEFILEVQRIINEEMFGSVGCAALWTFPINENGTMGKIKFANWRACRVIDEIDSIINICIPGEERRLERNQWMACIASYQTAIKVQ